MYILHIVLREADRISRFGLQLFGYSFHSVWYSDAHITSWGWVNDFALVTPYTEIWVNTGSGNGLLPDGTKPLPGPMLTTGYWHPPKCNFTENAQDMLAKIYIET